jgi:hypothetical protein
MHQHFGKQWVCAVLIFSMLIPQGWAIAQSAPEPSGPPLSQASSDPSAPARCSEQILVGPAVTPSVETRVQRIATLASEVAKSQQELTRELELAAVERTQIRVQQARTWVAQTDERILSSIEEAQADLDKALACKASGALGWAGRSVSCAYAWANKAMTVLSRYVEPVVISYASELVGLDSAGVKAVDSVRARVLGELAENRQALSNPNLTSTERYGLLLNRKVLQFEKWTVPYVVGLVAQGLSGYRSALNWLTRSRTPEDRAVAATQRSAFVQDAMNNLRDAAGSFNFREMRSNPYVLTDYLYRFTIVAAANIAVNFAKALPGLPALVSTPWHLIPNAASMMALQSEMAARKTVVQTGGTPAKDTRELLLRIPGIIAGNSGFVRESWARISTFVAGLPLEWPVLTGWTGAYLAMTGQIDPLSVSGWVEAGSKAFTFISAFGFYLIFKWAIWDKPVDLGFIPEFRGLASGDYDRKLALLAEKYGIPVERVSLKDPITGVSVQESKVVWKGKMWKQWADCFVPENTKPGELTFRTFFNHLVSLKWRPRLAQFRADYAKFREFHSSADVQSLNQTPEGKRRTVQAAAELLYRTGNTAFDTLVAILLAGSGKK